MIFIRFLSLQCVFAYAVTKKSISLQDSIYTLLTVIVPLERILKMFYRELLLERRLNTLATFA